MTSRAAHLVVLETPRLRIRLKHRDDAPEDFAWKRDPELARFDATAPLTMSYTEFLEQFERDLLFLDPTRQLFALESREGEHFGNIMYYSADSIRGTAEIGISVALRPYRGQGLGTEAVTAFVRYLWQTLPLRVIQLHTLDWNERAQHCFEKAGFGPVARVYRKGQWFLRMEARREWWLMWDDEGRFALPNPGPQAEALRTVQERAAAR